MVDAWGGWSLFQTLLQTLKRVATKHGVSIPTVAVRYILDQVEEMLKTKNRVVISLMNLLNFEFFLYSCFMICWKLQPAVAGSMVGVRLGLAEHIKDSNAVFSLVLDEEDVSSILEVQKKGKDLMRIIGDCGDEYRRA